MVDTPVVIGFRFRRVMYPPTIRTDIPSNPNGIPTPSPIANALLAASIDCGKIVILDVSHIGCINDNGNDNDIMIMI